MYLDHLLSGSPPFVLYEITLLFFACSYPSQCLPAAPTSVVVTPVGGQDFQRTVSWVAPGSVLAISGYTVTCSSTFNAASDVREKTVGVVTSVVIGDETGANGPLVQGRTYSCSVTAQNVAGSGPPGASDPFGTYVLLSRDVLRCVCLLSISNKCFAIRAMQGFFCDGAR